MFRKLFITKRLAWIWLVWLLLLLVMMLLRLALYLKFAPKQEGGMASMLWMGFRYDLRIASLFVLPVLAVSSFPFGNPFQKKPARKFWLGYWLLAGLVFAIFYAADRQYYAYRFQRLDAEVLSYMEDAGISLQMVWESYPVIPILLVLFAALFGWFWLHRFLLRKLEKAAFAPRIKVTRIATAATVLLMLFVCWGRLSQFPLRWSNAARLNSDFRAQMALNPFESFFNSLKFRNEKPDLPKVKALYPALAAAYRLPAADSFPAGYTRRINGSNGKKPNVVLVLCESFSYYKSSLCGNPLNPTPYFDSLSKHGLFFSNCFSPAYGTARGVWATLTGTPDVTFIKTASRNPRAVDQHTIINDFTGYSRQYFIGGSASWANIQGLIENNIKDVKLYEQEDYRAPKRDVWGISDKDLFFEAIRLLGDRQKPFFSIIQTANNHRPYTIPEEDIAEMGLRSHPLDSLLKYGFNVNNNRDDTNEEYNAMRYMDFCIKKFMHAASTQPWFNETIFLFIGDHGIRGDGGTLVPRAYSEKGLTCEHVPLLIYSPGLAPARYDFPCSQVDVLPTLAGLAGITYTNTTLGRDLLAVAKDSLSPKFAFIIDHDSKHYGLVRDGYYYSKEIKGKQESFARLDNRLPPEPANAAEFRQLALALLETSRYLIYNNKKEKP